VQRLELGSLKETYTEDRINGCKAGQSPLSLRLRQCPVLESEAIDFQVSKPGISLSHVK